ncbi:hypothetical protein Tco_0035314, partial [Tanacetum coccineum]
ENKAAMQKKEEIWQSKESLLVRDLTDALKIIDQLRIEKERLEELRIEKKRLEEHSLIRVSTTGKHSFEFDIPNCTAFGTTAIIDTGASAYCLLQWFKFKTAGYS